MTLLIALSALVFGGVLLLAVIYAIEPAAFVLFCVLAVVGRMVVGR